eukprot:3472547-Rhodomonas_salina.1
MEDGLLSANARTTAVSAEILNGSSIFKTQFVASQSPVRSVEFSVTKRVFVLKVVDLCSPYTLTIQPSRSMRPAWSVTVM